MRRYLSKLPRSTEELVQWHERYISPITLLVGFLLDAVIFRGIDLLASNIILFGHLCLAAAGIVVFHLIQNGYLRGRLFLWLLPFVPSVIQFSFGALFGGFVILYSQSAAYATSWIFIALLALFLVGNERFRKLYKEFTFQATIYFAVLMSFCVFFLPVIFLRIGTTMFLVSEAVAFGVMFVLLRTFSQFAPAIMKPARWTIFRNIAAILLIFNVLYFTNAIPPIPLALKEAGVYHSLTRADGTYRLEREPLAWYQQYLNYNTSFHRAPGERIYVFTAIYAPPGLSTDIVHDWEHYDEAAEEWILKSTVSFPISGGREEGYRGYSILNSAEEGEWRVNAKNGGKIVGRVSFTVVHVEAPVEMEVVER